MRRVSVSATIIVTAIGLAASGCASNSGGGSNTSPAPSNSQPATPPPTSHSATSETSKRTTAAPGGGNGSFTMPTEVGKGLQAAQDDVQRVSHDPLFITHSKDATGAGRFQILDRDWRVCDQDVQPGRKVNTDTRITFSVVKLDESCP